VWVNGAPTGRPFRWGEFSQSVTGLPLKSRTGAHGFAASEGRHFEAAVLIRGCSE
jgi:hypothetical protein